MGAIFVVMNRVHTVLFIPQLGVMTSFYNQYKEIWEASYGEKRKNFDPFAVSVMKDKEIVHILIAPSSHSKL